jgi:hypothetical protein
MVAPGCLGIRKTPFLVFQQRWPAFSNGADHD